MLVGSVPAGTTIRGGRACVAGEDVGVLAAAFGSGAVDSLRGLRSQPSFFSSDPVDAAATDAPRLIRSSTLVMPGKNSSPTMAQ